MILFFILWAALGAFGEGKSLFFSPKGLTEIKAKPAEFSETVHVVKQGDVLEVRSTVTDSLGKEWCFVRFTEHQVEGFLPSDRLEYLGDEKKSTLFLKLKGEIQEDARRRLKAVKDHPEWPRRIQKAVRDGAICLKMNTGQLLISWGEPAQKTRGFIVDEGDVEIFFFQPSAPVAVILKKGEVIGWSEKGE